MKSTKIFVQRMLMLIPFLYVLASSENEGADPYEGLVNKKQLAEHEAYKIDLMNKLWHGKDSVKNKKPNKEETGCLDFLRPWLKTIKKKKDDNEFTTNLLNNTTDSGKHFSFSPKNVNGGNDFSFTNNKADSEPETPKFQVQGSNPFNDISN
uniref:Uncharacterized protein n=1 Tax=Meloidogyne enterolobii TaxID=390850 RepID=A0A6V7WM71_MELEN|nr:unnamed protein product [Meloidogyne enterolobii]